MTPNPIAELIKSNDLAASADLGKFREIAIWLNDPGVEKIDDGRKIKDDLIDAIGAMNANTVLASLSKAGRGELPGVPAELCSSEWHALNGVGTNVSRPGVQELIKGLAALDGWPDGLATKVCEIGRWQVSIAVDNGFDELTEDGLQAAWLRYRQDEADDAAAIEQRNQTEALRLKFQAIYTTHVSAVVDSETPTTATLVAGLKAAVAALGK